MTEIYRPAERVSAAAVFELRRLVLRAHQPKAASRYPTDDDPSTCHAAVRDAAGTIAAVGSIFPEAFGELGDQVFVEAARAWRIRGMATRERSRGLGLGGALVEFLAEQARSAGARFAWCNARVTAAHFYNRHEFVRIGDTFELKGIGLHVRLLRQL